jgi:hypothetical protein
VEYRPDHPARQAAELAWNLHSRKQTAETIMKDLRSALTAATLLALAGCAGQEAQQQPNEFFQAEAAITQAEQAGAQRFASRELNLARQQLDQARAARDDGDLVLARRLANQAEADAQLAAARAGNEEMQNAVQELRASLETLREEIRRNE